MPEDKYSFIPTVGKFDGVRSFREQLKHVACAQFAFFHEFEGKNPCGLRKGRIQSARSKAELSKYLRDSFGYSNRVLPRSWRAMLSTDGMCPRRCAIYKLSQ
jgi:hypothetical protein